MKCEAPSQARPYNGLFQSIQYNLMCVVHDLSLSYLHAFRITRIRRDV